MFPKSPDELTITKASIRPDAPQQPDSSWDQRGVSLFLDFGAFEAKMVEVIAQDAGGQEYQFLVEAMQYPKSMNDGLRNPVPSAIWRGRLIGARESLDLGIESGTRRR